MFVVDINIMLFLYWMPIVFILDAQSIQSYVGSLSNFGFNDFMYQRETLKIKDDMQKVVLVIGLKWNWTYRPVRAVFRETQEIQIQIQNFKVLPRLIVFN